MLFLGKQDQVQEKLGIADILLMPSELESFGLAALEAMACEVVPIATRAGGVPEVIEHGSSGYLAEVGDVETMARYAIELLNDESRLRAMGKTGTRRGQGALLLQQDRSAIRRVLPARARALFVEGFRHRSRGLQQRQADADQGSLPFVGCRWSCAPCLRRAPAAARRCSPCPMPVPRVLLLGQLRGRHAHAIVFHFDDQPRIG